MKALESILALKHFRRPDIARILSAAPAGETELVRKRAEQILLERCGDRVSCRGLVEFSNICSMNCSYCGIRAGNAAVKRYMMSAGEILEAAAWCAEAGYGSLVLQSGERRDKEFVAFVARVVRDIKRTTASRTLPDGLGITLCVGEQGEDDYKRFRDAGAHRYLLRIETSDPGLFAKIHPATQSFESRIKALELLRKTGFQVGTGVMIGLPGQTVDMLAGDILFFRDMDIDMIGMGPYIPHNSAPMSEWGRGEWSDEDVFKTALLMIAAARVVLQDVNIAATTALQAMHSDGREEGLRFGANVIMPQITPPRFRGDYLLYENKPCIEEPLVKYHSILQRRIRAAGRKIALNQWGDSPHFAKSRGRTAPRRQKNAILKKKD